MRTLRFLSLTIAARYCAGGGSTAALVGAVAGNGSISWLSAASSLSRSGCFDFTVSVIWPCQSACFVLGSNASTDSWPLCVAVHVLAEPVHSRVDIDLLPLAKRQSERDVAGIGPHVTLARKLCIDVRLDALVQHRIIPAGRIGPDPRMGLVCAEVHAGNGVDRQLRLGLCTRRKDESARHAGMMDVCVAWSFLRFCKTTALKATPRLATGSREQGPLGETPDKREVFPGVGLRVSEASRPKAKHPQLSLCPISTHSGRWLLDVGCVMAG